MRRMPFNAEDIEKFVFISYNFVFSGDEKLEIPLVGDYQNNIYYKMFLKYQLGSIQNVPALIFDESTGVYIGLINDPTDNAFYLVNGRTSQVVDIQMYIENNILNVNITHTTEDLLVADNIKTLFGNQSIIGQGNIDLYVHHLLINSNCHFTIYSSNNLKVDTPEKLTTLLKDENASIYYFGYQQTQYIYTAAISFNAATNLWQIRVSGEETSSEITDVTDIVTTI